MNSQFINPNWHVILIHYPLGVFMLGLTLEVLLLIFRHHGSARRAARWMIVIGALSALPAGFAGMYAFADVAHRSATDMPAMDATWNEVWAASTFGHNKVHGELIDSHIWSAGGASVCAALLVTIAIACSDRWRKKLYPVFLVLLLAFGFGMAKGAWHAGEMVYAEGVAVKLPPPESEESEASSSSSSETQPTTSASAETHEHHHGLHYYVNPLQAHVTFAGVAAALCLLGIGLSLRAAATSPEWEDPELARAGVVANPHPQRGGPEDLALIRSFAPRVEVTEGDSVPERIPAARFWLITVLAAVLTAVGGLWVIADGLGVYNKPGLIWDDISGPGFTRRMAHLIAGLTIVVLALLFAILARFARRNRTVAAVVAVLLVAALAAQVWFGALMLFDGSHVMPSSAKTWYRFQQ
jgi:uncharacterized membrane protein